MKCEQPKASPHCPPLSMSSHGERGEPNKGLTADQCECGKEQRVNNWLCSRPHQWRLVNWSQDCQGFIVLVPWLREECSRHVWLHDPLYFFPFSKQKFHTLVNYYILFLAVLVCLSTYFCPVSCGTLLHLLSEKVGGALVFVELMPRIRSKKCDRIIFI